MCSDNPILGLGPLPNFVQINGRCVASKDTMLRTVLLEISKYLLLQRYILNDSLFKTKKTSSKVNSLSNYTG